MADPNPDAGKPLDQIRVQCTECPWHGTADELDGIVVISDFQHEQTYAHNSCPNCGVMGAVWSDEAWDVRREDADLAHTMTEEERHANQSGR